MTRHPLYGAGLAALGTLVLTPDTLFMRWSGMDGFAMVAWRGIPMGLLLIGLWLITERTKLRAGFAALCAPAGIGVILCHGTNAVLFGLGIAIAPVPVVLFGVATVPVFAAFFGWAFAGEPVGRSTGVATVAVLGGIGLAVFGRSAEGIDLNASAVLGALAGLGVAAALAMSFVLIRKARDLPILPAIGTGALLSGLIGFTLASPGTLLSGNLWAIALTGMVILPGSFILLSMATRHTTATVVSLLMLLETVLGPFWVWLGAGEAVTFPMIAGGGIVVMSLCLYLLTTSRSTQT
ncbi:MAG: EamA family transporter [Albidovulum sp.]